MSYLRTPIAIAHRGGAAVWPENTLTSFEGAIALGYRYLETDLHVTRDGVIVCFHDETLDRTTNGAGPIKHLTLAELRALDHGYRFTRDGGRTYPFRGQGVTLPTFEEALALHPEVKLNVEMKQRAPAMEALLWREIERLRAHDRVLVAAAHDPLVHRFREIASRAVPTSPGIRGAIQFWAASRAGLARYVRWPFAALQVPPMHEGITVVDHRFVEAAHACGIHVHCWTIDDPDEMRRLLDLGVDGIMTDEPALLGEVFAERGLPLDPGPERARRTMTKVVVARPGSYDRLTLEAGPSRAPGAGEVAIDVAAIGVNYADCIVRMGLYASAKEYVGWPITPGFEVAGTVRALGPGVTDLAPGERVFAVTRFDGYATELVAPRHQVFRVPDGLSLEEAAALPAVTMTAYFAIFELAHPRPGAKVLVHSAAGGVGGYLVELSKIAGAEVVAVVGAPHKVEAARARGADVVIDKSREPLWPTAARHAPGGYDAIFDANGVETLRASYRHVRPAGKLVVYGFHTMMPRQGGKPSYARLALDWLRTPRFDPLSMTNESVSVMAFNLSYLFDRAELLEEGMAKILGWLAQGRISRPPVTRYRLADVARAHADLESGQTVGKLVLVP